MANIVTIETTPAELDKVASLATKIMPGVAAQFGNGRNGGYIYICDAEGNQLLHKKLGDPDPEKMNKYREFSREKAERLLKNSDHDLSWQSRNPDESQWGGAVRLPSGHILSFSGLPELYDEAFCATVADVMEWATQTQLSEILEISANTGKYNEVRAVVRTFTSE